MSNFFRDSSLFKPKTRTSLFTKSTNLTNHLNGNGNGNDINGSGSPTKGNSIETNSPDVPDSITEFFAGPVSGPGSKRPVSHTLTETDVSESTDNSISIGDESLSGKFNGNGDDNENDTSSRDTDTETDSGSNSTPKQYIASRKRRAERWSG
ncbi:unnamed protein product [Ambrosiozyma monospora]|uniref:Unnamed protein product n=1 Tax=Ambrosiozyma monospora TaxID=43982 RepID=A0A9W7DI08_AMBMO|nr:unnamed protein product [Ambrosiozyma monospora]